MLDVGKLEPRWRQLAGLLDHIDQQVELGLDLTAGEMTFAQVCLRQAGELAKRARAELLAVARKTGRNVTATRPVFRPERKGVRSC
jgi:hypothetical protein